jgi:hypothetical protein
VDWEDYDSLADFLEDYDAREFSDTEWAEVIEHFDIELEPDTFEVTEDIDIDIDIADEWEPGDELSIDDWEDIAGEYENHENDFAEFEKGS